MHRLSLPGLRLIQNLPPSAPAPVRWRRWQIFFGVLLIAVSIGLAIVYGREPVYRASASVLTAKPKAVDTPSAAADLEQVAIQSRLLLGEELLGRVVRRLIDEGDGEVAHPDILRNMLSIVPVPETNLLELRAGRWHARPASADRESLGQSL